MARIDQKLLAKVRDKTGLSRAAVYKRIKKKANAEFVGNDVALLSIAAEEGIAIQRHATEEQLAMKRGAAPRTLHAPVLTAPLAAKQKRGSAAKKVSKKPDNSVFVVHDGTAALRRRCSTSSTPSV